MSDNIWEIYQLFLTDTKTDRLAKILGKYDLFKQILELPGDIVEGGVYRGAGLFLWAKLLAIFCPMSIKRVIGFDTFSGFPADQSNDADRITAQAIAARDPYFFSVTTEDIYEKARLLGLEKRIEIIIGDMRLTAPQYVQSNAGFRISLLNLDFDTFDATLASLEAFYDLVVPNGIIILDEYAVRGWGESDAVDKFFAKRKVVYRSIPWTFTPTAYIVKL